MNRKWRKRLAIAGGVLLFSILVVLLVGKYWIFPAVVRNQASSALREQWDGKLRIADVNFNWMGPMYLRGVEVLDATGQKWLGAGSVKLTLRNWPGLSPVVSKVDIETLELRAFFEDGRLQLPIKSAPPPERENRSVDLQALAIRNMSIGIVAEGSGEAAWDGLQLSVLQEEERYRIDLTRKPEGPGEELSVSGTVDRESLGADLALILRHAVTREESAALLAALKAPFVTEGVGRIDAQVDLRGRLEALSAANPSGTITLSDCSLSSPNGTLLTDLRAEVRLVGETSPGALADASASLCGGRMTAALTANTLADGTIRYGGLVNAEDVSLDDLARVLSGRQETRRGTLQFIATIEGHTAVPEGPGVEGYLYLDDAGLADVPLLTGLFQVVGITQLDALQATDVEATFTMRGPIVTIQAARLANAVAAIDVEPGGSVDIERHYLDFYAIVAPIAVVSDLLNSIPVVELGMHLSDKLTRLHIEGDWDAPPESLVSHETLQNIGEGTVGLVRDAASTGGDIGKTLFHMFTGNLNTSNEDSTE